MLVFPTWACGAHLRANGIRQHYYRLGEDGPPLVLVPGIVSPAALWLHVGTRLARHFRVHLLDVRGRGLSESGAHLDYGLDACADDVEAFAHALGLSGYTLVGHSMGARIGLRLARRGAGAVNHLVLLDPPASAPGRRPYPVDMARSVKMVQAALRGEGEAYLRSPGVAPWPEPLLRLRAEWLATCDLRAIEVAYRDFHAQDPYDDLRRATVRTSLLAAGASGVIQDGDLADLRAANPALRIEVLKGAAHQFQAENIDAFMSALGSVLGVALQ
ncbi:alpha/beta hydrolase [Pigmentiphaga soli]|uniref:Alpha/beta hydrolase n=1 Tax=Pigmentiphaga soli TaxID=1007095 RepID=A0ABP8HHQ6_9BURK